MTVHVAVLPLLVVAVMVAEPSAIAFTVPCLGVTVAIAVSLEVKVTVWSASAGFTVATRASEAPSARDSVDLFNVTPAGATLFLSGI